MVVAHRGASHDYAEHTLQAYVAAIECGADALECDVRLTRDGHLVCIHDRTLSRTAQTRGVVSRHLLDELHELDFSSWHGNASHGDGQVLELQALLELVHDASRPVRLLIETKHPTRYGGLVEKLLVEKLETFGWAGRLEAPYSAAAPADLNSRVVVMSFAATAIRRTKLLAPDIPTVYLMDRFFGRRSSGRLPLGVPIAGPSVQLIRKDPEFIARAHAQGNRVYVWTADDPADIELLIQRGADAIITNRPAEVRAQLEAASVGSSGVSGRDSADASLATDSLEGREADAP